jgi:hypothetical protein
MLLGLAPASIATKAKALPEWITVSFGNKTTNKITNNTRPLQKTYQSWYCDSKQGAQNYINSAFPGRILPKAEDENSPEAAIIDLGIRDDGSWRYEIRGVKPSIEIRPFRTEQDAQTWIDKKFSEGIIIPDDDTGTKPHS